MEHPETAGDRVRGEVTAVVHAVVGDRSTSCCNIVLHSGFDKNDTAASGCIFISIDNIVLAHDSTLLASVVTA